MDDTKKKNIIKKNIYIYILIFFQNNYLYKNIIIN